jgi:GDPmannose 4,6-dehydratase
MSIAIITGARGQDGWYLSRQLLAEGYRVLAATRDVDYETHSLADGVERVRWDMLDQGSMTDALRLHRPTEIYNLAAYSRGSGMFDDPVGMSELNGVAVVRTLEAIREIDPTIRFCQASSSEMFGDPAEQPQSEATPFHPRSPYGVAKLFAHQMVGIYRQRHGLFACSAILFNHESPRRGPDYVTGRITRAAAGIKLGLEKELKLGNLEARRDWGFAGEYVQAMRLMLGQAAPGDFVVASGTTHSVRDICEIAFSHLGLDYRLYVREDENLTRPAEAGQLVGDASKARDILGWKSAMDFRDLICMMVDADIEALASNANH